MKKFAFILIVGMAFASCSRCYECTYDTNIQVGGQTQNNPQTDEFCTASPQELEEKENQGYECTPV